MTTASDVYPVRNWVENCIFPKPIFRLDCADFSSNKIYDVQILLRGYQAEDLSMSMTSIRLYIFSADDLDIPHSDCASSSALFVFTCIHVRVPIRLRRYVSVA